MIEIGKIDFWVVKDDEFASWKTMRINFQYRDNSYPETDPRGIWKDEKTSYQLNNLALSGNQVLSEVKKICQLKAEGAIQ